MKTIPQQAGRSSRRYHGAWEVVLVGTSGASKDPQYTVAVWPPNINHDGPLELLDMVVFFSPHTGSYTTSYPFRLLPNTKAPPDQQYMTLGSKYLLQEYGFAYNLIARRRQAVMITPMCKAGKWGPYSSGEGIFRLCREVALLLHRECRTSNLGLTSVGGVDRKFRYAGGSLRSPGASIWSNVFGLPSKPGGIAIGGFSTGIAPVKSIMQTWRVGTSEGPTFSQQYWGCAGSSDEQIFNSAWMELWDLDGFHRETGGWDNYKSLLNRWAQKDSKQMMRFFHSLGQPDPKADKHPLWDMLFGEGTTY